MRNAFLAPFRYPRYTKEIEAEEQEETKPKVQNWRFTLKQLWAYLAAYKARLLFVLLMVILSSFFALAGPFMVGMAVDHFIEAGQLDGLGLFLAGLAVIYAGHSLSVWLQNVSMIEVAQRTVYQLRTDLFARWHELEVPFYDKKKHGELMSRMTNDIENVSNTLNSSFIQIMSSILILTGTLSVMLWLSPLLTLVTMVVIPVMYIGMKWITKRTNRLFKAQQRNIGALNGYIEETLGGQEIVKTYSQEPHVISAFEKRNARLRLSGFWAQTISGFIPKLMNSLNNFSFAIIACVGGLFALNGMITIGVIVIFTEYARQFTRPLNDLANQFNTILSAIAGAERVFAMMKETSEFHGEDNLPDYVPAGGKIEFDRVSFSYNGTENTMADVSFTARPGETVAFVGPTGAGKTTVINLLARFYEYHAGAVYVDEQEVKSLNRSSLRRQMAFVLQDSALFQGTIRENIRYGRLNATDAEVEEAARLANADGFIRSFTEGYETKLSQEGGGLSQGQRQLLAIARALLADPLILILDEATSSIDTVTEIKIQEALSRLMEGRTSLVIAHRLNTIRRADQIIMLQQGQVVERGTHEELVARRAAYYEMYQQGDEAV
ncbi:ATP-binding cassette subfamily B protein [Salsuginibacillus halophilus]|uniref:ATP-binding cassette subfamily B protein n=1 Tax=Salsuginibacillus halophilus TaxID=517424 RepID=A0A2P8HG68_9BACI|nr:ABC transporter ATP-binding protein [Salsuginibacillus halophilus]PSL45222.1 ATP-binding cassette subfamily B protein [Salsuginibacillus halophilus]